MKKLSTSLTSPLLEQVEACKMESGEWLYEKPSRKKKRVKVEERQREIDAAIQAACETYKIVYQLERRGRRRRKERRKKEERIKHLSIGSHAACIDR